jgi:hypothetical protein
VTIEARFTASSRSSGPQQYWSALYGCIWREFDDDRNHRVFGMMHSGFRKTKIMVVYSLIET